MSAGLSDVCVWPSCCCAPAQHTACTANSTCRGCVRMSGLRNRPGGGRVAKLHKQRHSDANGLCQTQACAQCCAQCCGSCAPQLVRRNIGAQACLHHDHARRPTTKSCLPPTSPSRHTSIAMVVMHLNMLKPKTRA